MELTVTAQTGKKASNISLSDDVFSQAFNEPLVHQIVTAYLAGDRSGTKAQKGRGEVRGGGRKPFRQKGSGRARAGSIRSPIWRGGAKAFAAQPRDYSQKVNKKMYRGAMRSILSELIRQNVLKVVDALAFETHKTKEAIKQLAALEAEDSVLFISESIDENMYLATRNLPRVDVIDAQEMTPVLLLKYKTVIMTVPAVKQIEELLK